MTLFRTITTSLGIALVVIYAVGSGFWVSSGDAWYRSLNTPSWQPPDWVFGAVWPYNFVVLGIASVLVSQRLSKTSSILWLSFFALSVACALLWAYQFYVSHNLGIATIALILAAILTLPMLLLSYRVSWWLFLVLAPYQVWLAIAASLSWGYLHKN